MASSSSSLSSFNSSAICFICLKEASTDSLHDISDKFNLDCGTAILVLSQTLNIPESSLKIISLNQPNLEVELCTTCGKHFSEFFQCHNQESLIQAELLKLQNLVCETLKQLIDNSELKSCQASKIREEIHQSSQLKSNNNSYSDDIPRDAQIVRNIFLGKETKLKPKNTRRRSYSKIFKRFPQNFIIPDSDNENDSSPEPEEDGAAEPCKLECKIKIEPETFGPNGLSDNEGDTNWLSSFDWEDSSHNVKNNDDTDDTEGSHSSVRSPSVARRKQGRPRKQVESPLKTAAITTDHSSSSDSSQEFELGSSSDSSSSEEDSSESDYEHDTKRQRKPRTSEDETPRRGRGRPRKDPSELKYRRMPKVMDSRIEALFEESVDPLETTGDPNKFVFRGIEVIQKNQTTLECSKCSVKKSSHSVSLSIASASRKIREHISVVHFGGLECKLCSNEGKHKVFKRFCVMRRHLDVHKQTLIYCEVCQKPFRNSSKPQFDWHSWTHMNQDEQDEAVRLGATVPIHPKRKPRFTDDNLDENSPRRRGRPSLGFSCSKCGKPQISRYALEVHEETHLPKEERLKLKLPCEQCGKMVYKSSMYLHIRNVHKKLIRVKKIVCDYEGCSKSYVCQAKLDIHVRQVHTKETPFICEVCGKGFIANYYLLKHGLTHTDNQVSCDLCGKVYKLLKYLTRHKKAAHKNEIDPKTGMVIK